MSPVFETQCSTENVISIILADFIRRCHIFSIILMFAADR